MEERRVASTLFGLRDHPKQIAKDSQSDEIIGFILNELEGRMEESQFIQLCETL